MAIGRGEIWAVGRVFQDLETQIGNGFKGLSGDFLWTEMCEKRCINGSVTNRKPFFLEGIRKLVDRWTKCIENEGDYVEK
jgi:hypothetical protein